MSDDRDWAEEIHLAEGDAGARLVIDTIDAGEEASLEMNLWWVSYDPETGTASVEHSFDDVEGEVPAAELRAALAARLTD